MRISQIDGINFGTTLDVYKAGFKTQCGLDTIRRTTWFGREDINWKKLTEIMDSTFARKSSVNILNTACSDGSEPYTLAIVLDKLSKFPEKYFPIKASDMSAKIIRQNNRRRIKMYINDFKNLSSFTDNFESEEYFADLGGEDGETILAPRKIKIKESLAQKVTFCKNNLIDVINNIKDEGNTVLICRNVFPYLKLNFDLEGLIDTIGSKLKSGSLFITGKYDNDANVQKYINLKKSAEFKQLEPNIFLRK